MDAAGEITFILKQAFTSATPLLLAGFGELVAQRAGVINVGLDGMMLMGAFAAYAAAVTAGSAAWAVPAAIGVGLVCGLIFAMIVVWFRADQVVAGTAMNLLAAGVSTTAWAVVQRSMEGPHGREAPALFSPVRVPGLVAIPILGPALEQYAMFYAVLAIGVGIFCVLRWSRAGLVIRSLGEAPDACHAAGIRVRLWRTGCVVFAGACAGAAGAYLSTMRVHSFQINITAGQGFLVLALVIFGRWSILGLAAGTLCFGAIDGLQARLAGIAGATTHVPHQLFDMLPYVATLAALAALAGGRTGPAFLGKPWPEDR